MEVVNVSGLKNNPSGALRKSHEAPGVKVALATALSRDGHLSLVRATFPGSGSPWWT